LHGPAGLSGPSRGRPTVRAALAITTSALDALLSWSPLSGAASYEAVAGSISRLRDSGGSFAMATDACIAEDVTATSVLHAGTPRPGDGLWFLKRGANCRGKLTYDSGAASQTASRDTGIRASRADSP